MAAYFYCYKDHCLDTFLDTINNWFNKKKSSH